MLDDLDELRTFQRILASGSLSNAARELGVGLAVVSKRLSSLERRAGQRLINRTTRRLSPTEEGVALSVHVDRLLEELRAAEEQLTSGRDEPHGVLRISAPISLGRRHLVPLAARLVERYAQLDVDLRLDDHLVELTDHRIDVAIRIGQPRDSTAIFHKLADNHRILVAAPAYLTRCGRPRSPSDLVRHVCLRYDDGAIWRLEGPAGAVMDAETHSRLRANSGDAVLDWGLAGEGILLKSVADVCTYVASGELERVLPAWQSASAPIYALVPSMHYVPRKTRVFLDAVAEHLAGCKLPSARRRIRPRRRAGP